MTGRKRAAVNAPVGTIAFGLLENRSAVESGVSAKVAFGMSSAMFIPPAMSAPPFGSAASPAPARPSDMPATVAYDPPNDDGV